MKIGEYHQNDRDVNLSKVKNYWNFHLIFIYVWSTSISGCFSPYNIENRPKQNQLLGALEPVPLLEGQFANVVKPQYANFFQGDEFTPYKWDLKKDQNEQGFAPGIDDLGRILLDNKSDIKFNKRLQINY